MVPPAPVGARGAAPLALPPPSSAAPRESPIPTSGAIEDISEGQAAALRVLAEGLTRVDYFSVLSVAPTASPAEIKKAFYRESRTYHPDRFFHLPESQVKTDLGSLYKRVTEAYYVLRDDAKRRKYSADMASAEREERLRYTEATEAELKAEARKSVDEEFGSNPKARPFFKTAQADIAKSNWAAAERNLKMGLMYEAGNARFKEQLATVRDKLEEQRKLSGDAFKIK